MLQSERCAKSVLTSPAAERADSSFHSFQMGNTSRLSNVLLEADESQLSPKFRRRKIIIPTQQSVSPQQQSSLLSPSRSLSTSLSQNHVDAAQTAYREGVTFKVNGVNPESKTVTFSLEPRPQSLSVVDSPNSKKKLMTLTEPSTSSSSTQQSNAQERISSGIVITEQEIKNLKDLVLLHLDLEQQQQSIIAEKDKIIAELRAESNMLKTRLERIDRRLSVAKSSTPKQKRIKPARFSSLAAVAQIEPSASKQNTSKREEKQTITENLVLTGTSKQSKLKKAESFQLQDWKPKTSKKLKIAQKQLNKTKSIKNRTKSHKNDGLLRVDSEYYTQQVQEFEELAEETIPNSKDTQSIEVPSFRVQSFANSYHLEGTEDIDEQTFLKRHQRHETDEKKRKRWDLQRQREQQVIEKLKQNQSTTAGHKIATPSREKHVENIFPIAEHAEYIEICDKLPVNVFGHPLPLFRSSEFSLPWYSPLTKKTKPNKRGRRSKR